MRCFKAQWGSVIWFWLLAGVCGAATEAADTGMLAIHAVKQWEFPYATQEAWYLGNGNVAWAISRKTGQVAGGWNARTKERYLDSGAARYYLEDSKSLQEAAEQHDEVLDARFFPEAQEVTLVCRNPLLPAIEIKKTYRLDRTRLVRETAFTSSRAKEFFVTYNTELQFVPSYRDDGYYMGSGIGGGTLVPAPKLSSPMKITLHGTINKGMLLSQPQKGYSFAHYRYKLDDNFVWPWWSSFGETGNALHYTPTGWEMSLGTLKLIPGKPAACEEHFSIFPGDWYAFYSREYPSLPEVQKALKAIPPVPEWVGDVKIYADFGDMNRLKRLVEMTDEGFIMVVGMAGGEWADYYVDKGLPGYDGGLITGPELKDEIQRVKAISPRIKVGIYNWINSTTCSSTIYAKHPEWFRKYDKQGNPTDLFPGMIANYATMLNIPACYDELLSQVDLQFRHLGEDFVYLDGNFTSNMVKWDTGEMTRDDDWYRFFLDMKRTAAKYGPDKIIFMNGWGNPYADVNFIEARSMLSGPHWRVFAGMGLGIETFLTCQPKSRIIPLYWTPSLARDYVNRVLALGWIPSLEYGDEVGERPFATAAYEIGNCTPVAADYSPDWKKDRETSLESYLVKRDVGAGHLFSLISQEKEKKTFSVSMALDSLDLDQGKPVCVWGYQIEDASAFNGITTESFAKKAYRQTGWKLDLVARPELRYYGPYQKEIKLDVELAPLQLYMISVEDAPAAVYSEDGLPANFLFSRTRKVALKGDVDRTTNEIKMQVNSQRDAAEVIAFVPDNWEMERTILDGREVKPQWVALDGGLMPVVSVEKGSHVLQVKCRSGKITAVATSGLSASVAQNSVRVEMPRPLADSEGALLSVTAGGRVLFDRLVTVEKGVCSIPIAAQPGGDYVVELHAALSPAGKLAKVAGARGGVTLPAVSPSLGLTSKEPESIPEQKESREVNRVISGVEVLSAATYTGSPPIRGVQPDLRPLMASVEPDSLTLEAGTTRKITDLQGAAFAGLELKDARKLKIRLKNTYHDAFHILGPGKHFVNYRRTQREFAGFMVDYHTANGYTKRVALGVGFLHPECNTPNPPYGKAKAPDQIIDLGGIVDEGSEKVLALDLARYAPEDWDGRVWFSIGSDCVAADRRLKAEILASGKEVTEGFITGMEPGDFKKLYNAPKQVTVPSVSSVSRPGIPALLDGMLAEDTWYAGAKIDRFFLLGAEGWPKAKTVAFLLYDETHLHIGFLCDEKARRKPITGGPSIYGSPSWADDDRVEVWLDCNRDGKTYRQIIATAAGETLEYSESGTVHIGARATANIEEGSRWTVTLAIPFKALGVKPPSAGDVWGFNLCRHRPGGEDFSPELITWAPAQTELRDVENFGKLVFGK
jgi:hypothetical protein